MINKTAQEWNENSKPASQPSKEEDEDLLLKNYFILLHPKTSIHSFL